MKRIILILLAAFIAIASMAQTHIYRGSHTYPSDILYTFDSKHLYRGSHTYPSDIIYTFDGKHLYRGSHTYPSDIILTTDGTIPFSLILAILTL
ncbi:MAG: hypothetical protein K2G24_04630 [Muribaculaceae bacterium]|nr:hypothetical protein [Muribaculaceae bacterium]